MADEVAIFKVVTRLKQYSGLTGNYHAFCHYSYNLPLAFIQKNPAQIELCAKLQNSTNKNVTLYSKLY